MMEWWWGLSPDWRLGITLMVCYAMGFLTGLMV